MSRKTRTGITIGALLLVVALGGIFLKYMHDSERFFSGTRLNGVDVSRKTPVEAAELLAGMYGTDYKIEILEGGETALEGSMEDYGYYADITGILEGAVRARNIQTGDLNTMMSEMLSGSSYTVDIPYEFDERVFTRFVTVDRLKNEREVCQDARLTFNKEEKAYSIVPEVKGNELSDETLQEFVKQQADILAAGMSDNRKKQITIPESLYIQPQVTAESPSLVNLCQTYNTYCRSSVVHQFGSQEEKVSWKIVKDWIIRDGDRAYLSEEKVRDYVISLEEKYNTRYHDRYFSTANGQQIMIPSSENEYGYTIDEDAETAQLAIDLSSGVRIRREPIYISENSYGNPLYYKREGTDDLAGNYVEVNLNAQHLWFYKDGRLVVESDLVSGSVARNAQTATGCFPLAYKESPSILVGDNATDGYRTEVQYWMPFYEGQGLHDAVWRSSFGGSIYVNDGSHGCVNLPLDTARKIYENIEAGMAIILYK